MSLVYVYSNDVHDLQSFCNYIQQTLGTPYITIKDKQILGKQVKDCFAQHPTMTWQLLCRVIEWAKDKKVRPARAYSVMNYLNYAWRDKYLPDLPSKDEVDFKVRMDKALSIETDPEWRQRLTMSLGQYKIEALEEWEASRKDDAIIAGLPEPEQLSFDKPKRKARKNVARVASS